MASKFWGKGGESSDDEDGDSKSGSSSGGSSKSSSGSESEAPVKATTAKAPGGAARWMALSDSSDEEERRVIRTSKEKQWSNLQQIVKQISNYRKIEDFGQVQEGFDSLLKGILKARLTIEKEGMPSFVVRALSELEKYVTDKFANKEALKKQTKSKQASLNALRVRVKKGIEEHRAAIEEYRASRAAGADGDESEDKDTDESLSSTSSSSSESESEEPSESEASSVTSTQKKKQFDASGESSESSESSDDEDEWSSSSSSGDEEGEKRKPGAAAAADRGEVDIHQLAISRWGKKTDDGKDAAKKKAKDKKKDKPVKGKQTQQTQQTKSTLLSESLYLPAGGSREASSIIQPGEKVDADLLSKKLQEVTALRGRKGFDRAEQIRHLHELGAAAESVGLKSVLEIKASLIRAYFDANFGAFACMSIDEWICCYKQLDSALSIMIKEKDCYFPFLVSDDSGSNQAAGGDELSAAEDREAEGEGGETSTTDTLIKAAAQLQEGTTGVAAGKDAKLRLSYGSCLVCMSFLERLDDELAKALRLADAYGEEYKTRLVQTMDMLSLLWKSYIYFLSLEQIDCAHNISLRILEHVYYKNNSLASKMWEMVRKRLGTSSAASAALLLPEYSSENIVGKLCQDIQESQAADLKTKTKTVLFNCYSNALHGRFYVARDLLQSGNVHEMASQCNTQTQILYNRSLVQLAMSAFRLGLITEAHSYLSEVSSMGRYKELMAQSVSNMRGVEKTAEREKLEKKRLLPYHMHIAVDLVEAVHNISAMLLEVPSMAANRFDYTKKPISRNFRKLLEAYDRQPFNGPPENSRETVIAATKALQKGDWRLCCSHIMSMTFWSGLPDAEKVKEILTQRIKVEALRTYLFTYSSLYQSFNVKLLADMFDLSESTAHSTLSKMMLQGCLGCSWDQTSKCVLVNRVSRTPLQILAIQLTEKIAQSVDQNETVWNYSNPKSVLFQFMQRENRRTARGGSQLDPQQRRYYGGREDQQRFNRPAGAASVPSGQRFPALGERQHYANNSTWRR